MKCVVCGKEFELKRKNEVCCSGECRRQRRNLLAKKWLVNHYEIKPKHKRICAVCGVEFYTNSNNKKYCSRKCALNAQNIKAKKFYRQKHGSVKKYEKSTYSGERPMTPALERFFIRFTELLKQVKK